MSVNPENSGPLGDALSKASRESRLAVYPKFRETSLYPFETSMNPSFLEEIEGLGSDDLRWFVFSRWLSEGWTGETKVLDALPDLKTYLEDLPAPEKTDFLIYRRVLNLMEANERGDLKD